MKVVILCGGRGTRLKEETEFKPKPLVEIGSKPILWHIMKIYAHYGFNDFVLCLGYKGNMIKEYFLNYEAMNNDFTIQLGNHNNIKFHSNHTEKDWKVTLVDTGEEALTGSRLRKAARYIDSDLFMLTYGDGVANIDIGKLVSFHKAHKKAGTITGVHPSSRFGEIAAKDGLVVKFNEKPQVRDGMINGGFFIFKKNFLDYLEDGEDCWLEHEPMEKLASCGELMVYPHEGFWQCVDTYRELELLTKLWNSSNPPWKVW
ncbi:MAG: glucose-1-phosphate cytidylyltransferase [Candidatus Omnitrophica bacterium]|nr:glucose-1-phosphate cytidylyltransferase [Candidatus Omnitrophota bacterium]MDD5429423.1 glucose-1-phosphate cytidylyltransferase [Candidatus Omnitrophota bacterium]